jgi:hypothetical protein
VLMYANLGMESSDVVLYSSIYQMTKCTNVSAEERARISCCQIYCSSPLLFAFPIYHSPLGFLRHVDISLRFRRLALFKVPSPPKGKDEMQGVASDKVVFGRSLVIGPVEK